MEKLKNACRNARDIALVHFLHATGCRVSEVVSVDVTDVDFQKRELVVYGKGGKERTVYLTPVAAMYLEKYLLTRKDTSKALFTGKGSGRLKKNRNRSSNETTWRTRWSEKRTSTPIPENSGY